MNPIAHNIGDAIFIFIGMISMLTATIQTLRMAALRRRVCPHGLNVIKNIVLPSHDDPRWTYKRSDTAVTLVSERSQLYELRADTHTFVLGDVRVTKQDTVSTEILDSYYMKVGETSFNGFIIGFAIKRYWRAIQQEHVQRTASKSYEAP